MSSIEQQALPHLKTKLTNTRALQKSLSSQQLTPDVKGNRGAGRLPRVLAQPSVDGDEDARSEGAGSAHPDGVAHQSKQAASAKKATVRKQTSGGRLNINRSRMQPGSLVASYQ